MALTADELNATMTKRVLASDVWFDDDEPECSDEEIEAFFCGVAERTRALRARRPRGKSFQVPRADVLGVKEQRDLERQIGVPVTTWSEAKEQAAARGLCFAEKGTAAERRMSELRKWRQSGSTAEERGPAPKCLPEKDLRRREGESMVSIYRDNFC